MQQSGIGFLNLIHFADAKMKKRTKEVGTSWMMDDIQQYRFEIIN